jgi:nucleotide-binding universal stress UspA family protein
MKIVIWLSEGTWEACVDATAELAPPDAEIVLLYVVDPSLPEAAHGAFVGLVGRGRARSDPGTAIEVATTEHAAALLSAAGDRLGRACSAITRQGQPEREVLAEVADAALLVLARDGDRRRLGPHTLGHATRFVLDHAPVRVLLVWPDEPPDLATIPPPPHGPPPGPPRHAPD